MGLVLVIAGLALIGIFVLTFLEVNRKRYYILPYEDREKKHPIACHFYDYEDQYKFAFLMILIVAMVVLTIMSLVVIINHTGTDAVIAENAAIYNSLIYKMESTTCRDEFGFLNKEVIDEVTKWNQDLAKNKSLQRDPWIGCFTPNIFDEFEFIDYNNFVIE